MSSYETTDAFLKRKFKEDHIVKHNVEDILVMVERLMEKVDQIEKRLDEQDSNSRS